MTTSNFKLSANDVAKALNDTSGKDLKAEEIEVEYTLFANAYADEGQHKKITFKKWEDERRAALATSWVGFPDKKKLPAELGAVTAGNKRQAGDVLMLTRIFIDSDDGADPKKLRDALINLSLCFLMTESATSLVGDGAKFKWHLFLPLRTPVILPSRRLPGVDAAATLAATTDWWHRVNEHVRACFSALGGLDLGKLDKTAGSFPRLAFVPFAAGDRKKSFRVWPGRQLDLPKFLAATGFHETTAPLVMRPTDADDSGSDANSDGSGRDSKPAVATAQPARISGDDDGGPTPGETTGSLLFQALSALGRVLADEKEPGKFRALCPWRGYHNKTAEHDPEGFLPGDTSVVFWTKDADSKPGGGFKCFHNGEGVDKQCDRATAADVIGYARVNGVPLPDTANWSGVELPPEVEAPPAPVRPALPPAFPTAPAEAAPLPAPPPWKPANQIEKVDIIVGLDLKDNVDRAVDAIARHPNFYTIDGQLYDLVEEDGLDKDGHPIRPKMRKTATAHLDVEITTVSRWFVEKHTKKGLDHEEVLPNHRVLAGVLKAAPFPGVRRLVGILESPVFRRDGTVLARPGYDPVLCVLYRPRERIPLVSPDPSRDDLNKAKETLLNVIADFPFKKGTEEIARGVWVSAIFTRLLRLCFTGNTPMFVVAAGVKGAGKGKLVDAATIISEGRPAEKCNFTANNDEMERIIGAAIKREAPVAVLDNIHRSLSLASAAFESYLTTLNFSTRQIGTSDTIGQEKSGWDQTLWWATGNGLTTAGDMLRRILRIDIEDLSGKPGDRKVRNPRLEDYCRQNRAELLCAVLTLLSGYFAARRRGWKVKLPPFASFEEWTIVREAVVWCGLPDPYLAVGKAEDDEAEAGVGALFEALGTLTDFKPTAMGTVCEQLRKNKKDHAVLWQMLSEAEVKLDNPMGASVSLGKYLKDFKGATHVVGGKRLQLNLFKDGKNLRALHVMEV